MKDELEDFVRQNRDAFDDKAPSEKVWRQVQASMNFPAQRTWWNSVALWRAAAIVFMVLSVYLLIPRNTTKTRADLALKEFNDVEAFYIEQISEKVELIDEFHKNEGLNGLTQDFQQLEAMYMVLKEEMKTHPSKKVKDALVLNLLVRINLLNQQLDKLDDSEKTPARSDKKTNV